MRCNGVCSELVYTWPHDHIGWAYSDADQFTACARDFLSRGAQLGERLLFVSRDPDAASVRSLVAAVPQDALRIASVAEVYGGTGVVDAKQQWSTYLGTLEDALADGYSGLRVAADNTTLVTDGERLQAWITWEIVADHLIAGRPMTALCAFDRRRIDPRVLSQIAMHHPVLSADLLAPPFRLFVDGRSLKIEGVIDRPAMQHLRFLLESLPMAMPAVVDLTKMTFITPSVLMAASAIAAGGVHLTVRAPLATIKYHLGNHPRLDFVHWQPV